MAAKLPVKLRSIRFRQRLSLWESWRVSAGEGEDANRSAAQGTMRMLGAATR